MSVSSLDKVLYPATGTTKQDIFAYYSDIAEVMLPHCRGRPATRKRWPNGVGEDGKGNMFFQKDVGDGVPGWVDVRRIQHSDHVNTYPLVNDLPTLIWLAQLSALEIHVPQWRFGEEDTQLKPDRLVLDLDPGPGVGLRQCAQVARLARDILTDIGLESVPVTSGSSGVHLYAPLDGSTTSDQAASLARELARSLEADHRGDITSSMKRADRPGKVFIDWSQNRASKTTVAPYSLRGKVEPTVAAPRTWRELSSPHLKQLHYREVLRRVERRGDPMSALQSMAHEDDDADPDPATIARDRLSVYRSKRDSNKTPEPVPDEPPDSSRRSGKPVFVIQRHEARRLHYDFRLEHDGVLVSWALPKGVPTDPKQNRLAVPTEDHPLEYRFFEGTIPAGEYGAGEMTIWDTGTAVVEKWNEAEVVATLTGAPAGGLGATRKFALFRTHDDPQKPQWMIHLMENVGAPDPPRSNSTKGGALLPMLATQSSLPELSRLDEQAWAFEMKWDGMRALISVDERGVRVRSRSGADVTQTYPEFAELDAALAAESCIIDGEIIARGASGAPSFSRLQQRMHLTTSREISQARAEVPVSFVAFDVLDVNGQSCTSLPYRSRRELLAELITPETSIDVPPAFDGDLTAALESSRDFKLEGIVAKRRDSVYRPGVRSRDWLKLPHANTTEAVVVGWRESEADALGIASLLIATPTSDGLTYAGRVGTGFSTAQRREIVRRLSRIERATPPVTAPAAVRRDARWVTPKLVGEISYRELTSDGIFRQPVWRGWRTDKTVADLTPE